MRILAVHADYIRYHANRKTHIAEPIAKKGDEMTDCVVLFSCVEKLDEIDPDMVIIGAKADVMERLQKLKAYKVMIFPYAHLTSTLSSPDVALTILKGLEESLKQEELEVKRAPFGWYKEFEVKSKGHPLSELSMTICPYEGKNCDFLCPYCSNPIKVKDLGISESEHIKA